MSTIKVYYILIRDDKTSIGSAEELRLKEDDSVAYLRKKVKEEQSDDLKDVSANRLTVYKLCKPRRSDEIKHTDFLKRVKLLDKLSGITNEDESALELRPEEEIGDEDKWPKDFVHVLVQRPASSAATGPLSVTTPALQHAGGGGGDTERPSKRQKTEIDAVYASPEEAPNSQYAKLRGTDSPTQDFLGFYEDFWGKPLPEAHVKLRNICQDPGTIVDDDWTSRDGDLLPEDPPPLISSRWKNLMIRAEYLRIYNYVEYTFNAKKSEGAVVTGQPGIGKTCWMYYVLRRRLGERLPVLLYEAGVCYLFCTKGVLVIPRLEPLRFSFKIWVIIDSLQAKDGIPEYMFDPTYNIFPIYLSSPDAKRWKEAEKCLKLERVIMNPWTRAEIIYAGTKPELCEQELCEVLRRYDTYGPTARLCIEWNKERLDQFIREQQSAILEYFGTAEMERFYNNLLGRLSSLSLEVGSHKLILVRRLRKEVDADRGFTVTPLSVFVSSTLGCRLQELKEEELLRMWKKFSNFGDARGMTGSIWEAYVHRRFREGIEITADVMWRHSREDSQWHAIFNEDMTNKKRKEHLKENPPIKVSISEPATAVYASNERINIVANKYYVPGYSTAPGLDSFIVHKKQLYIFQITAGKQHGVSDKMVKFFKGCRGVPGKPDKWKFIFVVPEDIRSFSSPYPSDKPVMQSLILYTAYMYFL